jgi:alkylation response protein AidB-like acyl-CoA dehydrogenase
LTSEEYQLLRSTAREFAQKNIETGALKIEQEALSQEMIGSMAAQGFIGARIPSEYGGTGLDEKAYNIVLEELARSSPSAAAKVLITNSLFAPLVMASEKSKEILRDVTSAKTSVAVAYSELLESKGKKSSVVIANSRARGKTRYVLNGDANAIVLAADDPSNSLLLVRSGLEAVEEEEHLGFRGLSFSSVVVDSADFETLSENGLRRMEKAFNDMDLDVAAVALGITSGALAKAIEYSKARITFEHPLKDYQPVAFTLSSLRAEEEMLRSFLYNTHLSGAGRVMARVRAVELAKNAAKQAIQVHGGYGYFEDSGVEKFYRDAMALSILFCRGTREMARLSEEVFQSKAGFI